MRNSNVRTILAALFGAAGDANFSQAPGRRRARQSSFGRLGSPAEQNRRMSAAQSKRIARSVKRQRDYDRCISSNPLFSGPFQYVLTPPIEEPPRNSIAVAMRYCGDKKKLQGHVADVRESATSNGWVEAKFRDALQWRGADLQQWNRFQLAEFEAI